MSPRRSTGEPALDIPQLRMLVALVDRGSITAAARTLGLAQSTVSEMMSALERTLGATIVVRRPGSKRARLSPAGEALLPHARKILAAVDEAQAAVTRTISSARASFAIIANESVSTYILSSALVQLRRRWPNTRFSVSVATCEQVREGLEQGRFDVGLLLETDAHGGGSRPSRASTRDADRQAVGASVPLILFASPRHPLAAMRTMRRFDLTAYRLFLTDAAGDFHAFVTRYLKAIDMDPLHFEAAGTVEGVKRAVAKDSRAIGILPAYAIADELRDRTFVGIAIRPPLPRMQLDALISRSRVPHPAMPELLETIRRTFASKEKPTASG